MATGHASTKDHELYKMRIDRIKSSIFHQVEIRSILDALNELAGQFQIS
jgi:hypothetical protein